MIYDNQRNTCKVRTFCKVRFFFKSLTNKNLPGVYHLPAAVMRLQTLADLDNWSWRVHCVYYHGDSNVHELLISS